MIVIWPFIRFCTFHVRKQEIEKKRTNILQIYYLLSSVTIFVMCDWTRYLSALTWAKHVAYHKSCCPFKTINGQCRNYNNKCICVQNVSSEIMFPESKNIHSQTNALFNLKGYFKRYQAVIAIKNVPHTVKPVLRDRCHEKLPVLKDHPILGGPTFSNN